MVPIRAAIEKALKCKETCEEETILFGLTGTGYFEIVFCETFRSSEMYDYISAGGDFRPSGIP